MTLISLAVRHARGVLELVEHMNGMRSISSVPLPLVQVALPCMTLARKLLAASPGMTRVVPPQCELFIGIGVVRRM